MSKQQKIAADTEMEIPGAGGWGNQLHETRIRRGLSVADISNTLHLDAKLIDAIETEDVSRLPGSSFVKGYLRSYARLLDMDHEPLVNAYAKVSGNEEPALTQVVKFKEASSKDAAPRSATWLVVAVLLVSLGIWWWSEIKPSANDGEDETNAVVETEQSVMPPPELVVIVPPEPEPPIEVTMEQEVEVVEETPVVAEEAAPTATVEEEIAAESPPLATITLILEQDSWIEINDALGKRLYMDVAKAGQSKTIEGEAPFKVLLGNAPGVTVEFNGEVYDHAAHNRKGVARFTLGE